MRNSVTALAAALLGCALLSTGPASAVEPAIEIALPPPDGRFEVGTRQVEMVDRSRRDTPGSPGSRRLMVQVTYPRAAGQRCRPSRYISPLVQPILMAAVAVDRPVELATGTCKGGRIAGRKRPVLVFSHAFTADRFVYGALINDLASRGYVVLAPDHPPDAFAIEYPDGKLVEGEYGRPLTPTDVTLDELAALIELRAADVRFVLSRALRLGRRDSGFLSGHLDRGRAGVLGHSLGGATAARVAQLDDRFDAAVEIDGSLFGDWTARAGDRTPFLLLAGAGSIGAVFEDQSLCDYMAGLAGPRFALSLGGALHFSFSDFQALAPAIAAADPGWAFAGLYRTVVGSIDPGASIGAQRGALSGFFARYVLGHKRAGVPRPGNGFSELPIACQS